ncbi:MAG: CDP-alcohol phosphatidyltransferase family protein [Gaiellaceae bacterium]
MISRKAKPCTEFLCEYAFRPAAHLVVLALLPLRTPPPLVVCASAATGIAGAVELARGHFLLAALLLQAKTVLDNADGQLARASGRVTAFGRYLDSEADLVVDAAIFAALGWATGRPLLAAAAFAALTLALSVNFNLERLYKAERGEPAEALPAGGGILQRLYGLVYAPQDRLVERAVERRLRGLPARARLAWHDRPTLAIVTNLGMSTQLAALGLCLALGRPEAFMWICLAELALLAALWLRRGKTAASAGVVTEA